MQQIKSVMEQSCIRALLLSYISNILSFKTLTHQTPTSFKYPTTHNKMQPKRKLLYRVRERLPLQLCTLTLIYMAVGLYDTHSFEWPFLLKFLCTKIVKQFVFLVQSIVFILYTVQCTYVFKFMKQ